MIAPHDAEGETEALDEDNILRPEFIDEIATLLDAGDTAAVRARIEPLHEADIADVFELIDAEYRQPLARALGDTLDADVIAEMNDWVREELLDVLTAREVADVVGQLDTDDAVSIIEELGPDERREVLRALDPDDRAAIEEALSYPEESAGRLMQRDLVAVPEHWTIGAVIDFLGAEAELPTDFWEIFVVDGRHHPIGTMRLSWVLTKPRDALVGDVMQRDQTLIPVDEDQEEVALQFQKYALISAAVVDGHGRLVGVITVDDIVHIIQEEAGEDVLRLSGAGDGDINEPVFETYRARSRWLVANLGTAMVSSSVIAMFEGTIERMVALAALTPIVASVGGNAATQTMAVTVRAIATNQLTEANTRRTIWREIRVAMLNGSTIAVLVGLGAGLVFSNIQLGLVIAAAVMFNIMVAGLAGVIVPVTLDRFRADPAVASSVFVTMLTDTMGFLSFLGLATATGLTG